MAVVTHQYQAKGRVPGEIAASFEYIFITNSDMHQNLTFELMITTIIHYGGCQHEPAQQHKKSHAAVYDEYALK